MTPEQITQWAREAWGVMADAMYQEPIQAFAAKVAAHEREECARVCDGVSSNHYSFLEAEVAEDCAAAIRARK